MYMQILIQYMYSTYSIYCIYIFECIHKYNYLEWICISHCCPPAVFNGKGREADNGVPLQGTYGCTLLDKFGRISLYVTDDAIAKLYVT